MFKYQASFDTLRSLGVASIGASYAAIGAVLPSEAVALTFKNATNGDVLVSTDGSTDMLFLPANSFNVYDIRTNAPSQTDFMFKQGTQFFLKDGTTVASSGTFYIEAIIVTTLSAGV